MLAQMAATAGSVAIGSTIGHGISSMLFGGRSEAAPAEQQNQGVPQQNTSSFAANCEGQAKEFSKCIEKADLQSCSWYLEQLKAVSFRLYDLCSDSYRFFPSSARQLLLNTDRIDVQDLLLVECGHFTHVR